jgi:nitrogen regulatory protein P-II 1
VLARNWGPAFMKKVEAIIRYHKVDDVKNALVENGIYGITVSEVRGVGAEAGHIEAYRGVEYAVDFVSKIKLEIVCTDAELELVVPTILRAASTGRVGDGKIFVIDLKNAIRIRTGETGDAAL